MIKRKYILTSILVVIISFFSLSKPVSASDNPFSLLNQLAQIKNDSTKESNTQYVADQVIVKYKNATNAKARDTSAESYNLKLDTSVQGLDFSVLTITDSESVKEKIAQLEKDPNVEYAQPNFQYYFENTYTNDPYGNLLWALDNTGQSVNGVSGIPDSDMDAPEAWNINKGTNESVIVAVIDSGVAYNSLDLINNMWDGIYCNDYQGNALGGCIHGYDFDNNDKDPLPDNPFATDAEHGSHVAGIIAASYNNNIGIAGVAPNAKIMALKTYNLDTVEIVKAIQFAQNNGAKIINASWGGYGTTSNPSYDQALYNAIASFPGLFITAAGNESYNVDDGVSTHKHFPSGFELDTALGGGLDNIITVAATDQNDNLASFSNYGSSSVDVGAPGVNIYSVITYSEPLLETFESTSEGNLPTGWVRGGVLNTWGVRTNVGGSTHHNELSSTSIIPYPNNASSTVTSPTYDTRGTFGGLSFYTTCDTEYYPGSWLDYMTLELSNDNGQTFTPYLAWDENSWETLATISVTWDSSSSSFVVVLPSQYLTNTFKFRFRWQTDSSINYYNGCFIDNIDIATDNPGYGYRSGTSMASPQVAGLAALVWGYRSDLTYSQVKSSILNNGDTLSSLSGKTVTGKRINAYKTLSALTTIDHLSLSLTGTQTLFVGQGLNLQANAKDVNNANVYVSNFTWTGTDTNGYFSATTPGTYSIKASYNGMDSNTVNVIVSPALTPSRTYYSGPNNWGVQNTKFTVSGDFNNDGKDDVAAMYDYGNGKMGIWVFQSNGTSMTPVSMYMGIDGGWNVSATRYVVSGDFNNDGKEDIAAMYDYGNGFMGIWAFLSDGTHLTPTRIYTGVPGGWNVSATKFVVSGDFNNDGKEDIGAMYDYGNGFMGIWAFESDGTNLSPVRIYTGVPGGWNVSATRYVVSGDFNNDGKEDIGAMYDYGGGFMGIWAFESDGTNLSPVRIYTGVPGGWNVSATKFVVSGDFNNDGKEDIGAMYDYGSGFMGIWAFEGDGTNLSPVRIYTGVPGGWNVDATTFLVSGDFDGDTYTDVGAMYNYGSNNMGIWIF